MRNLFKQLKDAIFPLRCLACQCDGDLWCPSCRTGFDFRKKQMCPRCDAVTVYGASCSAHKDGALDGVISATWYANTIPKGLVRAWKYGFVREAEEPIAWIMERFSDQDLLPQGSWCAVPVVLHARKERERGFDQGRALSGIVAEVLGVPFASPLVRVRYQKPQAKLTNEKRKERDLSHIFAIEGPVPEDVLLIDDVYTTGGTMRAAAAVLKQAGAKRVWGLVFARG